MRRSTYRGRPRLWRLEFWLEGQMADHILHTNPWHRRAWGEAAALAWVALIKARAPLGQSVEVAHG